MDLGDLREYLKPPFDPWVEDWNDSILLRSSAWIQLSQDGAVVRDAKRLVDRINGAARLLQEDAHPVLLGDVYRFLDDGTAERYHQAFTGSASGSSRARGRAGMIGREPAEPQLSNMQRWLSAANSEGEVGDLLLFVSRADNWFDVYKAAEVIKRLARAKGSIKRIMGPAYRQLHRAIQMAIVSGTRRTRPSILNPYRP